MNDHIDLIMEVMESAFDPAYGEAWTRPQVIGTMLMPSTFAIIAGEDGREPRDGSEVAGFAISRSVLDEEELLLLAVKANMRGRGIGSKILERFLAESSERGSKYLFLEMRDGNSAEVLYQRAGFRKVGLRKDYYKSGLKGPFDAITFALNS